MAAKTITLHSSGIKTNSVSNPQVYVQTEDKPVRYIYTMQLSLSDAQQLEPDASPGTAMSIANVVVTSLTRRIVPGGSVEVLAIPGNQTLLVGPVHSASMETGHRALSVRDFNPGNLDHSITLVGWDTIGTSWVGTAEATDPTGDYNVPGTGLQGQFWTNLDLSGAPYNTYPAVNPNYIGVPGGSGFWNPAPAAKFYCSMSLRGSIKAPTAGTYRFRVYSDDGMRLYLDGGLAIDDWVNNHGDRNSGEYTYTAGQIINIRADNFNVNGEWGWVMQWSINGGPFEPIPTSVLYPFGYSPPIAEVPVGEQVSWGVQYVGRD